jgi:hypothetical protein
MSIKYTFSIDPGANGACVIFADDKFHSVFSFKYNVEWRDVLAYRLWRLQPRLIVVEDVHSFSGQGVKSMHTFGRNIEAVQTTVKTMGYPFTLVRPQDWQKKLGLLRKEKAASEVLALQLFPQLSEVKGDIFDAVLIGYTTTI